MEQSTKVLTGEVRFSYLSVVTPKAGPDGGREKYSVSLIIKKTDTATINAMNKAIDACIAANQSLFTRNGKPLPKEMIKGAFLRDGDKEKFDDEAYKGCYFINASSVRKPSVVDANVQEIIDPTEIYSGMYGRATVNFYVYNKDTSKGIACGLGNLQKLRDGEPLGGGSSAEADFGGDNSYTGGDLI